MRPARSTHPPGMGKQHNWTEVTICGFDLYNVAIVWSSALFLLLQMTQTCNLKPRVPRRRLLLSVDGDAGGGLRSCEWT